MQLVVVGRRDRLLSRAPVVVGVPAQDGLSRDLPHTHRVVSVDGHGLDG